MYNCKTPDCENSILHGKFCSVCLAEKKKLVAEKSKLYYQNSKNPCIDSARGVPECKTTMRKNLTLAKNIFKLRAKRRAEAYKTRRQFAERVVAARNKRPVKTIRLGAWLNTSESRMLNIELGLVLKRLLAGEHFYTVMFPVVYKGSKEHFAGTRKAAHSVRTERIRRNGGKLSGGLALLLHEVQAGLCACCGEPLGSAFHLDHIEPLALGGSNSDSNIQLLHPRCNMRKNARKPIEFMRKEFPDRLVQWARETLERRKLLAGL